MADESTFSQRRGLARSLTLIFVLGWGLFLLLARPADAGPPATASPLPTQIGATATGLQALAAARIEWFSHCDAGQLQLGVYLPSDGACSPHRTVPLSWLQSQLHGLGGMAEGEYLERMQHPTLAACGAAVFTAAGQHAGWVCLDSQGVYRADAFGQGELARWQLLADGRWVVGRP